MGHFKQKFPFILVFTTGMCIMAVELTASRLLAPYFGTSLFVWTNIIAVIMVALAVGYWLGGRISEKHPEISYLLKIIIVAGIFSLIIPFAIEPLASFIIRDLASVTGAAWLIIIGSFIATMLLFFIPIMLLGMTSPYIIKILSIFHTDVGNVSGSVFAVGTIGSIFGTFLPSIVFIAWIGSRRTILVFGVVMILIAVWGLVREKKYIWLALLILIVVPFVAPSTLRAGENTIYESESVYQYIKVDQVNGERQLKYNESTGVQSVLNPYGALTGHMYFDVMAASPAFFEDERVDVLNIGLAGGTAVRGMHYLFQGFKDIHVNGIEIDDKVIEVAHEYFDLDVPNLSIHIADGRIFTRFDENLYDLILVDAYSNQIYIPWHLSTDEFFLSVNERLNEGGIVALNLNATSTDSKLYRAITNTMAHNFKYVYSAPIKGTINYLIFASNKEVDFEKLTGDESIQAYPELLELIGYIIENLDVITYNSQEVLLTDDKAPIEHLTDSMYWEYLLNY